MAVDGRLNPSISLGSEGYISQDDIDVSANESSADHSPTLLSPCLDSGAETHDLSSDSSTSSLPALTAVDDDKPDEILPASHRAPQGYSVCDGVNYPPLVKAENLEGLKDFVTREDDIFLCTFVKSGTTWMQQALRLLANKGECDPTRTVNDDVPYLEESLPNRLADRPSQRLIKTHLTYDLTPRPNDTPSSDGSSAVGPKYIYIIRNPRDVAVSLFYHTRAFKSYKFDGDWDAFFEVYINGKVDYGPWFDHVLGWWNRRHQNNILIFTYEDMQQDLESVLRRTVAFLDWKHVDDDVIARTLQKSSFGHMSKDKTANYSWDTTVRRESDGPFLRKGKVGDWKNHFTAEQTRRFDELCQQHFANVADFPSSYVTSC